jgi:hypothetical protein
VFFSTFSQVEQSKAFVRRQDAFVAQRRLEKARAAAEEAYTTVQGKRQCPNCGMEQTFEEVPHPLTLFLTG